jgi:GNAT superfamily N-acetyltransferase
MKYEIIPLKEEHLGDASRLVSRRYQALLQQEPLLPPRYAQVDTLIPILQEACAAGPALAALQGAQLVGFMAAYLLHDFIGQPAAFSPELCNAAELDDSPRIYTDLYARLSAAWADQGYRCHLVSMLPNDQAGIQGWHWLGFGGIAADGVRSLEPIPQTPPDFEIRRAQVRDAPALMALDQALNQYLAGPPVFFPHGIGNDLAFYTAWLADPKSATWFAYQGPDPMAYLTFGPALHDACQVIVDEGTSSIPGAYTAPHARGRGIGAALLNHGLAWARQQGYQRSAVDFEAANPLALRFWRRFYNLVSLTLMRRI